MASTTVQKNIIDIVSNSKNYQQVNDASEAKISTQVSTPVSTPVNINLEEFPDPSSMTLSKQETRHIKESNLKSTIKSTTNNNITESPSSEQRTRAFSYLADKEKIASSLVCTKPCHNVTRLNDKGQFGVCMREHCTFAHSEQEFVLPRCSFDQTCRFKYGRRDFRTNKSIAGSCCKFRHSGESVDDYYKRTGNKRPFLPVNSLNSRKQFSQSQEKPVSSSVTSSLENQPRKSRWDEKPVASTLKSILENKPGKTRWCGKPSSGTYIKSSIYETKYSNDSEDSSSSDSESESHRRTHSRTRKSSFKENADKENADKEKVIRVPNEQLASIAIEAAFDRGHYNIRVVIEE